MNGVDLEKVLLAAQKNEREDNLDIALSKETFYEKIASNFEFHKASLKPTIKVPEVETLTSTDEDGDEVQKVRFFFLDAKEDKNDSTKLQLFGKVQKAGTKNEWLSCCVVVENCKKHIFLVKKKNTSYSAMELDIRNKIKGMELGYKENIQIYPKIKKKYCFDFDIAQGEVDCIEIVYPNKKQYESCFDQIGSTYKGKFGSSITSWQHFLFERGVKGPCWLEFSCFQKVSKASKVSYCQTEFVVEAIEDIEVAEATDKDNKKMEFPSLKVAYIDIKKCPKRRELETVCLNLIEDYNLQEKNKVQKVSPIILSCNQILQSDILREKYSGNLTFFDEEEKLLSTLLAKLFLFDADLIVGH